MQKPPQILSKQAQQDTQATVANMWMNQITQELTVNKRQAA